MYRYFLAIVLGVFMISVSVFLRKIANDKELPIVFGDLKETLSEKKHYNKTHFNSNIKTLNASEKQDSLIAYFKGNVHDIFSCFRDTSCNNQQYIQASSKRHLEAKLLNFKSKLIDLNNCKEVDYQHTFKYYAFLSSIFEVDSININQVSSQYFVSVYFPVDTNNEVKFKFKREDEDFYLEAVSGLNSFFANAEKVIIEDRRYLQKKNVNK